MNSLKGQNKGCPGLCADLELAHT